MADEREPPPLFGDEIDDKDDSEDLFSPSVESKPIVPPVVNKVNTTRPQDIDDDKEDIFADADTEVPLDDSPTEIVPEKQAPATLPTLETAPTKEPSPEPVKQDIKPDPVSPPGATIQISNSNDPPATMPTAVQKSKKEESKYASKVRDQAEEDEEATGDRFNIDISVTDPKKMGDGMNAYMAYKVTTKTTLTQFKSSELNVYRRFSDFLGLHDKLVEKHQGEGRIIPHPPEKSVLGMTKIKISKEEAGSAEFVEKRRASLERFLNRIARHPVLQKDSDLREFLELDGELPRATGTSALSGASMLKLFSRVGDSLNKMTFKMDETDQWFEEKQQHIEQLDLQLHKLHASIEALVQLRKELAQSTGLFAKSCAMLGNAEEHTALSRALSQLAEVEERVDQVHMDQADADFFVFSELLKDYIALTAAVKDIFHERVKLFKMWKEAEATLTKRRENKVKFELANKQDKVAQAQQEITEGEERVEKCQEQFEKISRNIRDELGRFEKQRIKDFKSTIINYLESLMNSEQQVIKYWETFLPEAKAIA